MKKKLTILIPTFNNQNLVYDCLNSVKDLADEILVVDSGSTDHTLKICELFGARILHHYYDYSAKQKNWAIPKAKNNWILLIDTDERVSKKLAQEIKRLLQKNLSKFDGFAIARKHYFLNKWLRFGGRYPLYNIRLFRKFCRYEDRDVHAHIVLPKKRVKKLKDDIIHYSDRSLENFFEKFNRYTTYQANYMLKLREKGVRVFRRELLTNILVFKAMIKDLWYFLPFAPFLRFFYMYFFRLGFLDGKMGFLLAFLYSFEDYVSRLKFRQLKQKEPFLFLILFHHRLEKYSLALAYWLGKQRDKSASLTKQIKSLVSSPEFIKQKRIITKV